MNDEQRAQLQREMGQAFYADVLKLEDENKRLREALEGSQTLNGVDAARVAQMQRELELAKDELATLTVRFDETAKELRLVEARDAAIMRRAAYELIEREWAEFYITQAIRLPGGAPDWYVNGCGLGRTLFSAVEKWRELQQQKGDKEP